MEPAWIDAPDAISIHERLVALEGGVGAVRDRGLLESALARPRQLFTYGDAPDVVDLAAAYTAGIVGNHPFVDGNKRTGFVVGILFLELSGWRFTASQVAATHAVMALAAGRMDEAGYGAFLRGNVVCRRRQGR
jgi:death-on-curing protein